MSLFRTGSALPGFLLRLQSALASWRHPHQLVEATSPSACSAVWRQALSWAAPSPSLGITTTRPITRPRQSMPLLPHAGMSGAACGTATDMSSNPFASASNATRLSKTPLDRAEPKQEPVLRPDTRQTYNFEQDNVS